VHGQNSRTRRGFRSSCLAAWLALGATLLAACADEVERPPDTTFEYVALGDSFTATGLPPARGVCRQSTKNYPHLVAKKRSTLTLIDASCGGAATKDMLASQRLPSGAVVPPQFSSLSADTDLVTVSLGGNDYNFISGFLFSCLPLWAEDPKGDPCSTLNRDKLEGRVGDIRTNLAEVLEEVSDLSPGARVIMVGYPQLLPADRGDCPRRIPIATGDIDFVREMTALLVEAQQGAAEDAGVEYVDAWTASEGHDACSEDPWIQGDEEGADGSYPFHPTPAHQRAVADMILKIL